MNLVHRKTILLIIGFAISTCAFTGRTPLVAGDENKSAFADPAEEETWKWLLKRSGREEHIERDGQGRVKWVGLRDEKNERGDYYTGSVDLNSEGLVVKMTFNAPHLSNDDYERLIKFKKLQVLTTWHNGWVKSDDKTPYSGAGLTHLKALPLESFNIGGSWFNDEGMKAANELPRLRELLVYHTRVTDLGIKALRNNDHLRKLAVGPQFSQRVTEACLADIATLSKLEELEFNETILTWDGGLKELATIKDHLKKLKLEHALIPAADYERLQTALPNTEIEYKPATAEQAKQMQAAAAQAKK
jgi:hypothetical protein